MVNIPYSTFTIEKRLGIFVLVQQTEYEKIFNLEKFTVTSPKTGITLEFQYLDLLTGYSPGVIWNIGPLSMHIRQRGYMSEKSHIYARLELI